MASIMAIRLHPGSLPYGSDLPIVKVSVGKLLSDLGSPGAESLVKNVALSADGSGDLEYELDISAPAEGCLVAISLELPPNAGQDVATAVAHANPLLTEDEQHEALITAILEEEEEEEEEEEAEEEDEGGGESGAGNGTTTTSAMKTREPTFYEQSPVITIYGHITLDSTPLLGFYEQSPDRGFHPVPVGRQQVAGSALIDSIPSGGGTLTSTPPGTTTGTPIRDSIPAAASPSSPGLFPPSSSGVLRVRRVKILGRLLAVRDARPLTETERNQHAQILTARPPTARQLHRSAQQEGRSERHLELRFNGVIARGFSLQVLHGDKGPSAQVRVLDLTLYTHGDSQGQHERKVSVGRYHIPKTHHETMLHFDFAKVEQVTRCTFEYAASYGRHPVTVGVLSLHC